MAPNEKQKKGVMYVYKLDTGSHLPPPSTSKKVVSQGFGLLRRSKTYRENQFSEDHEDKQMVQESARKSVSVMEGGRNSVSLTGRRSVGNTAAEMNVVRVATVLQVRVLVTDMPTFMQIHAFRCARNTFDSLEKFSPKQIALNLKKKLFERSLDQPTVSPLLHSHTTTFFTLGHTKPHTMPFE